MNDIESGSEKFPWAGPALFIAVLIAHYLLFFMVDLKTTGDHVNNFIVPFVVALLAFGLLFIGAGYRNYESPGPVSVFSPIDSPG